MLMKLERDRSKAKAEAIEAHIKALQVRKNLTLPASLFSPLGSVSDYY